LEESASEEIRINSAYPLSSSETERQRLASQAAAIEPLTLQMLRGAGLRSGARVLELGCGSGEVTTLLMNLIGDTGSVVAIDADGGQLEAARRRLSHANNVDLLQADICTYDTDERFDAVVGRYILIYLPSPEMFLHKAANWLAPGGALGFVEMDLFPGVGSHIWPPISEHAQRAIDYIGQIMIASGAHMHMSARLPSMLAQYGQIETAVAAPTQWGAGSLELPFSALRSVLPRALALRDPLADAFDVDCILQEEMQGRDHTTATTPPMSIGAWTRSLSDNGHAAKG
jgi:SAM-dependent methyltransferase